MVAGAALSDDLTNTQWLVQLEDIGEEEGYFSPLGDDHAAVFVDRSQEVLFVSFETLAGVRSVSETGMPLGFDVCESRGWSHLTLLAMKETWYRSHFVYGYFDRLVDEGFFEDFDKVIFYGAGMCGYAAAAFSVVAPGATVIAVSPQASLARDLTEWDTRFEGTRRMDFTSLKQPKRPTSSTIPMKSKTQCMLRCSADPIFSNTVTGADARARLMPICARWGSFPGSAKWP